MCGAGIPCQRPVFCSPAKTQLPGLQQRERALHQLGCLRRPSLPLSRVHCPPAPSLTFLLESLMVACAGPVMGWGHVPSGEPPWRAPLFLCVLTGLSSCTGSTLGPVSSSGTCTALPATLESVSARGFPLQSLPLARWALLWHLVSRGSASHGPSKGLTAVLLRESHTLHSPQNFSSGHSGTSEQPRVTTASPLQGESRLLWARAD